NMGDLYFDKKALDRAQTAYENSVSDFRSVGIKTSLASAVEKLGRLFLEKGDLPIAEQRLNEALDIDRSIRNRMGEASALYHLSLLDKQKGDIDKSLEEIERSLSLTETLRNETANAKLRRSYSSDVFDRYELYVNLVMAKAGREGDKTVLVKA